LRLGVTAFGGPAAHVAMMENEVVVRRGWLSHERFLDLLGAANLIPGPSSSELAVFIGYEQAGPPGLLVAGLCFVVPAALLTSAIAWAYVRFGTLPRFAGVLYGVKPVVIAIVAQALWGLGPKAIKGSRLLALLGVAACIAAAFGVDALAVMLAAGFASIAANATKQQGWARKSFLLLSPVAASATAGKSVGLLALFLVFAKLGAVVFGSGYVLVAFLRSDLVERLHWITESQLIDAVAVGQVTPGPVFTTATFIGYLLAGGWGALVATIGIFLPGFALVAAIRPVVSRVRRSPTTAAFLDGVNVAALALMAVVTARLARAALVDAVTIGIALTSAWLLVRNKVNSTWLIIAGALVGLVIKSV
jgi:chromate transporter